MNVFVDLAVKRENYGRQQNANKDAQLNTSRIPPQSINHPKDPPKRTRHTVWRSAFLVRIG